jgi:hypothetical protein
LFLVGSIVTNEVPLQPVALLLLTKKISHPPDGVYILWGGTDAGVHTKSENLQVDVHLMGNLQVDVLLACTQTAS